MYPLPASPYFLTPQRSRRFKSQTSVGENHHTVGSAGVLGPWPPVSGCAFSHPPGCPPSICPEFLLLRAECLLSILGAYGVRRKLRFPLLLGPPKRKRGGPLINPGLGHSASLLVQPEGLPLSPSSLNHASQMVLCIRITCEALKTPTSPSHPRPITSGPQGDPAPMFLKLLQ